MSLILEKAARPSHGTFAGGEASLADIAKAGRDSLLYVDNANAAHEALDRALEDRIRAIHAATGEKLENPLRRADSEWRRSVVETGLPLFSNGRISEDLKTLSGLRDRKMHEFERKLSELDGRYREIPEARQAIGAGRPVSDDAARIAREADERLGRLMGSRDGLAKWGAVLAGGLAGSINDPITVLSLGLGAGPGTARTVAGRVLSIAGKEALINAGTEAVIQPSVQAWREKAGLDHGFDQALSNVVFAGLLGGAFGGAIGAAGEGVRRLAGRTDVERAADTLRPEAQRLKEPAQAILANDGLRAADSLAEIREELAPAARGALDAAENVRLADEQRPPAARPDFHDDTVAVADAAIRLPDVEVWPGFSADPAQVSRVTEVIFGPRGAADERTEPRLVSFLIDRGGVKDFKGELDAIGATRVTERFRGRLVNESGSSLDYAREAAAEAGFFDHLYGTPDEAVARSTIADLIDAIEDELGGRASARAPQEEAAFAGLEATVAAVAREMGPAVDDALVERAARIVVDEGVEPFDAVERVLVNDELAGAPGNAGMRTGDPLPGWSDAELMEAANQRGTDPRALDGGLDDPATINDADLDLREFADLDDDMLIPTESGLVSASELLAGLERHDNLYRVTQACRI